MAERNHSQPQQGRNQDMPGGRSQQPSKQQPWDGHERRIGAADRRTPSGWDHRHSADTDIMNQGSSR